jgi:hypothetical protein
MPERSRHVLLTNSICGIIELTSHGEGEEWGALALARLTEGLDEQLPAHREVRFASARFANWQLIGDAPTFLAANLAQMQSELEAEFVRFQHQG